MERVQPDNTAITADSVRYKPGYEETKNGESYRYLTKKHWPILSQLDDVQVYRTNKAEILSAAQILVLKFALSPAKLEKATFLQLCQGFEILNKAERLDSQLSTENVSVKIGTMKIGDTP